MTFTCGTCWREFPAGWESREQHMMALGHEVPEFECNGNPTFDCEDCSDCFSDEEDLRDHEVEDHFYCDPCVRYFNSYHSIQQHLNSKIHRTEDLKCPFCEYTHPIATGLIHHLERNCCPNAPLDRTRLYEAVQRRDPNGVITKKLLEDSTPVSVHYEATELAFNPAERAYECYLCGRLFQTLGALNQHLASPRHQMDIYKCPNKDCRKTFSTLAATINHLESESCRFMRFEAVQRTAERIIDPRRMIAF